MSYHHLFISVENAYADEYNIELIIVWTLLHLKRSVNFLYY